MATDGPTSKAVLKATLVAVAVALALYLMYLLRKPISWLVIAAFLALAAAGPVNFLSRYMKRGIAIAITYILIIAIPLGLIAGITPSVADQVENLVNEAPEYARDVEDLVQSSELLQGLDQKYKIVTNLKEGANDLPDRLPDAAGTLKDLGVGFFNSIFAGLTILVLSVFMVAGGPRWARQFVESQRPEHAERIERTLKRIADAVGNYVAGAILQATLAGLSAFIVLTILGVPFAAPLALLVAFFDLIPVVGASIAGVAVGVLTLFVDWPLATIVWAGFVIGYQQIENYLIQPQIQKRASKIEPFTVLMAVLFGTALFGIIGAVLAIPTAAAIQITISEWRDYQASFAAGKKPRASGKSSGSRSTPATKKRSPSRAKKKASARGKRGPTGKRTA
ncbi:MAG: AI-2E family transporter [bacterium]